MKLGDQMRAIQSAMQTIAAAENRGKALIAFDQVHLWEQLLYAPGTLKIVCVWDGDVPRTNFPGSSLTGRVDRHFSIVASRGRGLSLDRAKSLTDGTGNARPLYDIMEDVFQAARLLNIQEHDEGPIDYLGTKATDAPDGMVVDAYQVMFSAGTQIGAVTLNSSP